MLSRLQSQFQEITQALQDGNEAILDSDILALYLGQLQGLQLLTEWFCIFRGKPNTPLSGGNYKLRVTFSKDYPFAPPECWMEDGFQHYHVFQGGRVCYKLLSKEFWKLSITMSMLLSGIVKMLHAEPAVGDPAASQLALFFCTPCDAARPQQHREPGSEVGHPSAQCCPGQLSYQSSLMKYYAFLEHQSSSFKAKYLLEIAHHAPKP